MSNRAYIAEIKTESDPIFNATHDEMLMTALSPAIYEGLNCDGVGFVELGIDVIEDAIETVQDTLSDHKDVDPDVVKECCECLEVLDYLKVRAIKNKNYIQLSIY
jgi:hypothetical protein